MCKVYFILFKIYFMTFFCAEMKRFKYSLLWSVFIIFLAPNWSRPGKIAVIMAVDTEIWISRNLVFFTEHTSILVYIVRSYYQSDDHTMRRNICIIYSRNYAILDRSSCIFLSPCRRFIPKEHSHVCTR